jgi:tetratricopeptide (TPR) repeat protein
MTADANRCPNCAAERDASDSRGFCTRCLITQVTTGGTPGADDVRETTAAGANGSGRYPGPTSADLEATGAFVPGHAVGSVLAPADATVVRTPDRDEANRTAGGIGIPRGLPVGTTVRCFGDYELLNELGRGGMGVVYKAWQVSLNRPVALKMIKVGVLADDAELQRFQNEAEAIALLDHAGIVPVYEVGEHDGQRYFSMKLVEGGNLADQLATLRADPRAAATLLAETAEAVHHAHMRGILHRDLKPANILVDKAGHPHVTDFGLAKRVEDDVEMTASGAVMGTPAYMSPEQAAGRRGTITTATDVYGLGAILYALLTGKAPFGGASLADTLQAVKERPPEPPRGLNASAPGDLETICLKCLEKDPRRRYASAQALADDLRCWLDSRPIAARRVGAAERLWLWCKRKPAVAALAATVLFTVVGGTVALIAVQANANRALEKKNTALTQSLTREAKANADLNAANVRVKERLDLAMEAIKTLHTGVSEDFVLEQDQFKDLRDRLLTSASGFYEKLGALLKGDADRSSRRTLLQANQAVAGLSYAVSGPEVALVLLQRVLAGREALAAASGGDPELATDVAESLLAVGAALQNMGRADQALAAYRRAGTTLTAASSGLPRSIAARSAFAEAEARVGNLLAITGHLPEGLRALISARDLQKALAAETPGDVARQEALAFTHIKVGGLLEITRKTDEALASYQAARAITQELAEAHPATPNFRNELATSLSKIGGVLSETVRRPEGLASLEAARAIQQKLVKSYPGISRFQYDLADNQDIIGAVLGAMKRPAEALASLEAARAIRQKLVDADPANIYFQDALAKTLTRIGDLLGQSGRKAEALASLKAALSVTEELVEANPAIPRHRLALADCCKAIGRRLRDDGRLAAALPYFRRAVALRQAEVDADPSQTRNHDFLAWFLTDYAMALREAGRHEEAFRAARRALAIWTGRIAEQPNSPSYRSNLAWTINEGDQAAQRSGGESEWLAALEPLARALKKAIASYPNVAEYRANLSGTLTRIADVQRAMGSAVDARGTYDRAITISERLVKEHAAVPMYRSQLAYSLRRRGLAHQGQAGTADARMALEIYDGLPSRSGEEWYETACCHAALGGRGESAGAGPAENDRAMVELRSAVGMGFVNLNAFRTEAALGPLRDREDFRMLMMDLEMPVDPFARGD